MRICSGLYNVTYEICDDLGQIAANMYIIVDPKKSVK